MNHLDLDKISRIQESLQRIANEISALHGEQSYVYENMSGTMKNSAKGEASVRVIDLIKHTAREVDDAVSTLEYIFEDQYLLTTKKSKL